MDNEQPNQFTNRVLTSGEIRQDMIGFAPNEF